MTAICSLFFVSCESLGNKEDSISVSIRKAVVNSEAGQQFVNVQCEGDWTLAIVSENAEVDWASLSVTEGTGNKSNVVLKYEANNTDSIRDLKLILDNGSKWAECTLRQYAPGQESEEDLEVGGEVDVTKTGWLELPAMNDPNLNYYSHSFKMGGQTYRNYSFGYSQDDYLAIWVAYPLCKLYTNGSSSGGDWEPNPLFSASYQPNFAKSFGFTQGYERGHQIANADRKCCSEANQQTYYFTNATLQHKDFNGPVWGVLEGNMRSAANSADTLYVVTGCVVPASPKYISDSYGHKVPVPSGYFKAAVRYHKASTQSVWMGAAFYLDHDASKYSSKQITSKEAMSIAELEKKVGIDFFVNLPDKVGAENAAKIESQNPVTYSSVWGII